MKGLSKVALILSPILDRKETIVKMITKRLEKNIDIAKNTGAVAAGAVKSAGAFEGRSDRSEVECQD